MKKLLLLVTGLGLFTATVAQEKGDFEVGGNIGVNFSNIVVSGNNIDDQADSKTGFNIGATGEYYFSDRWGLKAKLIYDQKGWADSFAQNQETGNVVRGDMKVDYLTIPVMANWHFGKQRNWYLNFGFYGAFLLKAEVEGVDTSEGFNNSDFGLALGIGVKFPVSDNAKLFIEYDGQSGFSNIAGGESDSSITLRNGRSAFNIGVLFDL